MQNHLYEISMQRKPYSRRGYDNITKELYSSQTDSHFVNLADHDKMMYLLKLDNNSSSKIIA